ncbi:MAG TPA: bifunctional UDP-3-O-[3-hydroxymyristoyl] N-acetylglucosamine deacetylase/3-hydroxyacyl-ACP dehydratase [Gemmatimonadaceae bacterium]|nr:bifunctional UDP-3-O-[3-hydroxymyristoyl] N-acetylglucosamine deacetylase/3-hydroxyacyl-ACP dehydratase [Gemmatimonadaceae bacterium]
MRRTIAQPATIEGVGLHLGHSCRLTFRGARSGTGIRFRRVDLPDAPVTPALVQFAVLSERRTQLGEGDGALHTVEHVLASVAGLEIDDLEIEMNAPEPPVLDGSAVPFVDALQQAGIAEQPGTVHYLDVRRPVRVEDGESVYDARSGNALELAVTIDFPHPLIGRQAGSYCLVGDTFRKELAPARTFGFVREVEMLRGMGLIRGASTANAVVLDEDGIVDSTLRWPDEFVRHKALDCVGDLALAGKRVRGRITAHKPSHRGTVMLVRELVTMADEQPRMLGIEEIMKVLPHRYPFLLVDRIVDFEPGKRIVGIKNVTINEPFFQGHFPGHPIMPGVLIIEAMAQVGGMLLMGAVDDPENKIVYFMSLDHVKFRRPVKPGDQIRFELDMQQIRGSVCKMRGVGYVDGNVVVEADMAAMIRDR